MRGVLICGGTGSRLRPLTDITNKSLLPVYDKPLILYPIKTLLDAGIRHIAVITGTEHIDQMTAFLGSGTRFGCEFAYRVQDTPGGIAQALGLAEDFAQDDSVCAILGDNVYFDDLSPHIRSFHKGGHVFLKEVPDPERFGIAEVEERRKKKEESTSHHTSHFPLPTSHSTHVLSIEEKPEHPRSNYAITGCYLYDSRCFDIIRNLKPSSRGEMEITDVGRWYLDHSELTASILEKEWVDAGTFESLFSASRLVRERSWAAPHSLSPRERARVRGPGKPLRTSPQSLSNRTARRVRRLRKQASPVTPGP